MTGARLRWTVMALAATALTSLGSAEPRAATVLPVAPDAEVHAGPVFAGDGIAWIERAQRRFRLVTAAADGTQASLALTGTVHGLRGSPELVLTTAFPGAGAAQVLAGRPGAGLAPVVECSEAADGALALALDATRVAYGVPRCGDPAAAPAVAIADLSGAGGRTTFPLTGDQDLLSVELAGRFLGVLRTPRGSPGGEIVVVDRTSRSERLRVTFSEHLDWSSFELQEDGAAAWCEDSRLRWASPASPVPAEIPGQRCAGVALGGFAGGRLLYHVRRADPAAELRVTDLAGAQRTIALGNVKTLGDGADWDGQRAALLVHGCTADTIVVAGEGDPVVRDEACPVQLPRRVAAARRGLLSLRVRCPRGCRGTLQATLRAGMRATLAEAQRLALGRGKARTFALRLPPRAQRALRRYAFATLEVAVISADAGRPFRSRSYRIRGQGRGAPPRRTPVRSARR